MVGAPAPGGCDKFALSPRPGGSAIRAVASSSRHYAALTKRLFPKGGARIFNCVNYVLI